MFTGNETISDTEGRKYDCVRERSVQSLADLSVDGDYFFFCAPGTV